MNASKPFDIAVSTVLGTALAIVATGCAKSDNAAEAPAADTSTAAAPADGGTRAAANAAVPGADTGAQSPGSMELHRVMEEGEAMPMTMSGDMDKDFASMMTMHHQTAIKMIDVLQQKGQSAELKALGAKMKADQLEEIKKMAPHASAGGAAATGHEGMAGMDHGQGTGAQGGTAAAELHRIMEESKAMPMTMSGNVDKDFATMMTMHHKTAIKMIDVLQQNGKAADLKALGAKMKANQQAEIKKMEPFTK